MQHKIALTYLRGGECVRAVGVSFHQNVLAPIILTTEADEQGYHTVDVLTTLIREPKNPQDKNAIAVKIGDQVVGHLAREIAPHYQQVLKRIEKRKRTAVCAGRVGWKHGVAGNNVWVVLDLAPPAHCHPDDPPMPPTAF